MSNFELKPGDILVTTITGNGLWDKLRRACVGKYGHVFLYLGQMGFFFNRRQGRILRFPMIFESYGRGVCLRLLSERWGEEVVVMRLRLAVSRRRIPSVITEALTLASDESARYDYWCITRYVLPRIICKKLHLPLPLSWHRDPSQICSEAVYEACFRGGIEGILPPGIVPLPGDFATDSPLLEIAGEGKLSADWVE